GRHGNAAAVRGCAGCGPKRPIAARRARPALSAAAGIRRRTTVIAKVVDGGTTVMREFTSAVRGEPDIVGRIASFQSAACDPKRRSGPWECWDLRQAGVRNPAAGLAGSETGS